MPGFFFGCKKLDSIDGIARTVFQRRQGIFISLVSGKIFATFQDSCFELFAQGLTSIKCIL